MNKIFLIFLFLCGCATAQKINNLSLGMTKAEAIKVMGIPSSTSATHGVEYLTYALYETDVAAEYGITTPYFVRIVDGKVDAYGKKGDFDSTKEQSQTLNVNLKSNAAAGKGH